MESKIRVLPDVIANKIAAGEVVERPASVVKELLENAVDAGASKVFIEVRGGGKDLIRITDDGCGMTRDDAILAFERHATSKISRFEDLEQIRSFGFRGEAVPSIAAVSRVCVTTAAEDGGPGTEIQIAGGNLLDIKDSLREPGTTFEVQKLFFNVPARRKFLKAPLTELSHVTDMVTNLALANISIHFRLISDGRLVLDFPAGEELARRIARIVGERDMGGLISIEGETEAGRLTGWVS
ncbi:ATP-binding protein, partial [bacterium]|nr:ATP-binding protein [candidate division CSSED10-310 bacterium]